MSGTQEVCGRRAHTVTAATGKTDAQSGLPLEGGVVLHSHDIHERFTTR